MATRSVPQPPFSAELLADLHADNVSPELREQLWPAVRRDGDALRFVHALDDVSAELRALGRSDRIIHAMPDDIAARLEEFVDGFDLNEEPTEAGATIYQLPVFAQPENAEGTAVSKPPAAPISLDDRRRGRLRYLTAAAAAVAVVACASIALTAVRGTDSAPVAQPTSDVAQFGDELNAPAMLSALGRNDATGLLSNPAARERCVRANGLDRTILGSNNIRYQDRDAVLILLTGPRSPKITALVVGTGCTTADPQRLTVQDIG
ncbi:hypothetical protein DFR70_104754 [Nocardia tenerifensis]|uniref:Anti-sigma-M factor RsmA n=1 Tax=Nocardia tenerifensis TaxID=228006 RepID=A0A318K3M9_9NOCA|nr:hypothetical protein [Nocardia tenerifensis]PXX65689.1 hypothetical protein DFR70_104754 [Nocardia tenerifensis]